MRPLATLIVFAAFAASACSSESAPVDCNTVASSYAAAMKDAVVCDTLVPTSCAATRAAALQDACQCQVAVNPLRTAHVDQLATLFNAQGCGPSQLTCDGTCPVVARSCVAVPAAASTCTGP
jgi:hypothetical protein